MKRAAAATVACFVVFGFACTGAKNGNPILPPTGTAGSSGGPGPVGTVTVSIEMPTAGSPLSPGTLVDVHARVTVDNSDAIDSSNVIVTVTQAGNGQPLDTGALLIDSVDPELFKGRVSLGDLMSGQYRLTVTARSTGGAIGSGSVDFAIDSGATVIVKSPKFGGHYKNSVVVEIIAFDPAGLMEPPSATIANMPVTLTAVDDPPNLYRGTFDFNGPNPRLDGQQILIVTVTAYNGRRTEVRVVFEIDNAGPEITMTRPAPGEIVGNVTLISAIILDDADVLDSSVIAVIGDERTAVFEVPLRRQGVGVYAAFFDTHRLTQCKDPPDTGLCIVFPTISFRAVDQLGNERTVGYAFAVDNVAPVADLDPPLIRDSKQDMVLRCSWAFDPLALRRFTGDMPDDGKAVPQVFDLRARIQDDGNRASGLKLVPIAHVDAENTSVFILDETTLPLVVDTDGNGTCDSINPLLVPTTQPPTQSDQVLKVRLGPVPVAGSANFTPDASVPTVCEPGIDPTAPEAMCPFQPTIAIGYAFKTPAIWAVEPITSAWCHGGQFDTLANNIKEGWACIAVGTMDRAGSFSVSAPLRVYIQYPGIPMFGSNPPPGAGPPPACTGIYDRNNNTVTPGACTTRKYPAGEICYRGEC